PDYALLELAELPSVTPTPLGTRITDVLAVIQHPRGQRKVIAEGTLLTTCGASQFIYNDLDTLAGSSGAGVLDREGYLIGMHTDGDCTADGTGANRGWSAELVVQVSAHLQPEDIEDR